MSNAKKGFSLLEASRIILAEGGVTHDAVVLLDREEEGKEALQKSGIKIHALLKISKVANKLYEIGAIDETQMKTILKQIKK